MCRYSIRQPSTPKPRRTSRWPGTEPVPSRVADASVLDFEGNPCVCLEPFEQLAVQHGRRRPETAFGVVADIARQAYRGLTDHFRGGAVAGISIAPDACPEPAAFRRMPFDDDVEESGLPLLGRRAFAGFGQHHFLE